MTRLRCSFGRVLAVLLAVSALSASAAPLPRTVLFIDEDTQAHPWSRRSTAAFLDTLKAEAPYNVYVYVENLGVDSFADDDYLARLRAFFRRKYRDKSIGVIVCHSARARPYVLALRDDLWPDTPVVLAGIDVRGPGLNHLPPNVTGFTFRRRVQDIAESARALLPDMKTLVLAGDRLGSLKLYAPFAQDVPIVQKRFEVIDLTGLPVAELKERLAHLPEDAAVAYLGLSRDDATGENYIPAEALRLVAEAANRPTFVDVETYFGSGSVGGLLLTPGRTGAEAARLALRVLGGEKAADIPVYDGKLSLPIFDWRQLKRWGISERRLPAGSEVRFRPPTAWQQYQWQIMAIAVALAAQTMLILFLLQSRRRRQAEISLAVSEDRLALTTASTRSGLWTSSGFDQTVEATESCAGLFGRPPREPFTLNGLSSLVQVEDRQLFLRTMAAAFRRPTPVDFRFRVTGPDGTIRWLAAKGSSAPRSSGGLSLTGIFTDVTALKQLELDRDLQRQELTHLMRQAVVNELSGSIAHELSQPLGATLANAEAALQFLDREPADLEVTRECLGAIARDLSRVADIIHRVRRTIKSGNAPIEPIEVDRLLDATVALLRHESIHRAVTVEIEQPEAAPPIVGDFVQLQQILVNFVMNAMDAMSASDQAAKRVVLRAEYPGDCVRLVVSDNGPGLAKEIRGRVLEPYVSTKPDGLGLGLTICEGIARAHGGGIHVDDNPDGGVTAALTLPLPGAAAAG